MERNENLRTALEAEKTITELKERAERILHQEHGVQLFMQDVASSYIEREHAHLRTDQQHIITYETLCAEQQCLNLSTKKQVQAVIYRLAEYLPPPSIYVSPLTVIISFRIPSTSQLFVGSPTGARPSCRSSCPLSYSCPS